MKEIYIITVVFNAVNTIEKTITSIINQKYERKKYIVIDGGSTDGTLEVIDKYKENIDYFISEKDNGIYDAMNKGIKMVNNPEAYIVFINADDYFNNEYILKYINDKCNDVDFLYGNILLVDEKVKKVDGKKVIYEDLLYDNICHQTIFVKKKIFNDIGLFSLDYKLCSDYHFVVKCFQNKLITKIYLDEVIACMGLGGASSNYNLVYNERLKIIRENFKYSKYLKAKINIYFEKIVRVKKKFIRISILKRSR